MIRRVLLLIAIALAVATKTEAQGELCDAAARQAAVETGVPLDILMVLTRVETGRARDGAVEPWPWTLNMGGPGTWYDTAEAALAVARRAVEEGRRNIDLGCFQINYHWHGDRFEGLAEMLDPQANARYAAIFLGDLHQELGDWTAAAGAFHSRTPTNASRYLARFREIRAAMVDTGMSAQPSRDPRGVPASLPMDARPPLLVVRVIPRLEAARPIASLSTRPLWGTE